VIENTMDEKIMESAEVKLKLDHMVIQQGKLAKQKTIFNKDEMLGMILHGANYVFISKKGEFMESDIHILLEMGEKKTAEKNVKIAEFGESSFRNFTLNIKPDQSLCNLQGQDFTVKEREEIGLPWIGFR
jgi:SWI/SNF-related matrix-associated actin-dependent regulator of chromatin subfamily A member 5